MLILQLKTKPMKKKWLKNLGLAWLTALTLGWAIKEGMSQTNQNTTKNLQETLGKKQDANIDKSKTYVATAADFQTQKEKQATIDSVKITQALAMVNIHADKLIEFYGKEKLSKKVRQVMKEYPDFWELSYLDRKPIIEAIFADFFSEHAGNDEIVMWVALAFFVFMGGLSYVNKRFL